MSRPITKLYPGDEVTVVWKPEMCAHSGNCFRGLPAVFDPRRRPWVVMSNGTTEEIVAQVARCPSGALSIRKGDEATAPVPEAEVRVDVLPDGPLFVTGPVDVRRADGSVEHRPEKTAFCRCGGSGNKPYCDGTHARNGFRG